MRAFQFHYMLVTKYTNLVDPRNVRSHLMAMIEFTPPHAECLARHWVDRRGATCR